jgi:ribosomal protein L14E/L6E/L27E
MAKYYLKIGINEKGVYTRMVPAEVHEEERKRIEMIPKLLAPRVSDETETKSTATTKNVMKQV